MTDIYTMIMWKLILCPLFVNSTEEIIKLNRDYIFFHLQGDNFVGRKYIWLINFVF